VTKPNSATHSKTKYICDPKRQTRNLKNEAMERVISNEKKCKFPFSSKNQTQQMKKYNATMDIIR